MEVYVCQLIVLRFFFFFLTTSLTTLLCSRKILLFITISWDEWVDEERTLRLNLENLARQKQLNEAQRERDRAEREALLEKEKQLKLGRRSAPLSNNSLGSDLASSRGTKRGRESASGDHVRYF